VLKLQRTDHAIGPATHDYKGSEEAHDLKVPGKLLGIPHPTM
jgi:hypothetical protein